MFVSLFSLCKQMPLKSVFPGFGYFRLLSALKSVFSIPFHQKDRYWVHHTRVSPFLSLSVPVFQQQDYFILIDSLLKDADFYITFYYWLRRHLSWIYNFLHKFGVHLNTGLPSNSFCGTHLLCFFFLTCRAVPHFLPPFTPAPWLCPDSFFS